MSGIDIAETQRIFAESKIILNENFFPGLTMRVLQGLSAGAIVFTEQSPYGDSFGLKDNNALICYNPDNILDRLTEILDNYDAYAAIGIQGQEKCRQLYSCSHVASELLSKIDADGKRKRDIDRETWNWNQTVSELLFAQRFGGNFSEPMRTLKTLASSASGRAADAQLLIGDIQARFKDCQPAIEHYRAVLDIFPGSIAALKLALLHVQANEPKMALTYLLGWLRHDPKELQGNIADILKSDKEAGQSLLSAVSEIYFSLGRQWQMGFQKEFRDPVPDTAFDVARMAWEMQPSVWALEMMARCLKPYHMQGELLPYMLAGIGAGILSDKQILETARTAFEYYDRDTASAIMSAMKKAV